MSLHLIPLAFGAAMGSAAVFVWKDDALRKRIIDESIEVSDKVNAYVAGLVNGGAQTMTDKLTFEEPQQQPISQPPPQPAAAEASPLAGDSEEPAPSTWAELQPATDAQADPKPVGQAESTPAAMADVQPAVEPVAVIQTEPQPAIEPAPVSQAEPQPAREPDQHRCEAKTKTGNRCRSKTYTVVSMPWGDIESAEVGLCWRHTQMHEKGKAVPLMGG